MRPRLACTPVTVIDVTPLLETAGPSPERAIDEVANSPPAMPPVLLTLPAAEDPEILPPFMDAQTPPALPLASTVAACTVTFSSVAPMQLPASPPALMALKLTVFSSLLRIHWVLAARPIATAPTLTETAERIRHLGG